MTLSRPRTTGRVLRGSALGLGLLVAGGVTAPAALAIVDPDPTTEVPVEAGEAVALEDVPADVAADMAPPLQADFGTGKDFTVQVTPYGPSPRDLDLSGAQFRATPTPARTPVLGPGTVDPDDLAGDETSYTCTTDQTGACTFSPDEAPQAITGPGADASIPEGRYTLTQVSSSVGLQATTSSTTFTVCGDDYFSFYCWLFASGTFNGSWTNPQPITAAVGNDSLFRTTLVTTVLDQADEQPISGAGYTLTTPGYPARDDLDAIDDPEESTDTDESVDTGVPPVVLPPILLPPIVLPPLQQIPADQSPVDQSPADQSPAEQLPADDSPAAVDPSVSVLDLAGDDEASTGPADITYPEQISDEDGELTFGDGTTSWFLPGAGYTLTPTSTVPTGFGADAPYAFALSTTPQQAALRQPLPLVRTLGTGVAGGAQPGQPQAGSAPVSGGVAAATTDPAAAAAATTGSGSTAPAASTAALAVTGSPVGSLALVGGGLVALGGAAMAAGALGRRRARQRA